MSGYMNPHERARFAFDDYCRAKANWKREGGALLLAVAARAFECWLSAQVVADAWPEGISSPAMLADRRAELARIYRGLS